MKTVLIFRKTLIFYNVLLCNAVFYKFFIKQLLCQRGQVFAFFVKVTVNFAVNFIRQGLAIDQLLIYKYASFRMRYYGRQACRSEIDFAVT